MTVGISEIYLKCVRLKVLDNGVQELKSIVSYIDDLIVQRRKELANAVIRTLKKAAYDKCMELMSVPETVVNNFIQQGPGAAAKTCKDIGAAAAAAFSAASDFSSIGSGMAFKNTAVGSSIRASFISLKEKFRKMAEGELPNPGNLDMNSLNTALTGIDVEKTISNVRAAMDHGKISNIIKMSKQMGKSGINGMFENSAFSNVLNDALPVKSIESAVKQGICAAAVGDPYLDALKEQLAWEISENLADYAHDIISEITGGLIDNIGTIFDSGSLAREIRADLYEQNLADLLIIRPQVFSLAYG